ncbi:MAG: transporter substrate-binding domain-containing protein [Verrucomicrobiales bacterium]|nr:transporter substrate-binding domain-containing protein [Verrucomicrobiales bacterium]
MKPLLATILALFLITACSNEDSDALVVGMELAYPPFEMRNDQNEPEGISVSMARDLGKFLNRPVEIRDVAWDGIIPALKSGKIDLIISSMTKTEERARSIAFSDGYVTNGLCLLVPKDSPIESKDDLKQAGLKIAVKLSTTGEIWAKANLPDAKFTTLDTSATCVLEVVQGRADAFIYDQISIYQYWKKHPDTTRPILQPIRDETWGVGLRKGDTELKEQVNAFLEQYRSSGGFDRLADRYMKEEKEAFEKLGVPFVFH